MRKVYCDVCGKLVNLITSWETMTVSQPSYQDFCEGFYAKDKTEGDVCPICHERLKKAVAIEIKKIKEDLKDGDKETED
jgi:rubrerythrin